jgi:pyridoxine 5-phosphate synthase
VTTEGGLDVKGQTSRIKDACQRLAEAGCRVSLFIDADPAQIEAAAQAGAPCIELHTGALAHAWWDADKPRLDHELSRLQAGLRLGRSLGLRTHAGHGLALTAFLPDNAPASLRDGPSSTALVAAMPDVGELHIGHALIGHALMVGLPQAVADFKAEIARSVPR